MSTAALALRQAFMAVGQPREPQPQSAQERKKMLKRADAVTLLLEKISTRMLGYALARLETQQFADPQPLDDDVLAMMMVLAELIDGAEFEAILDQLESLALDEFDSISALHGPTTVDPKPIAQLQRDFGSELLTGILRRSAAEVNQIVASGIESGMSRRDIAEMLQARFPVEIMPDWRARLIAQTEVTRAMNNASRNTYARLGRETLQWLDGQPGACPSCSALHGKSVPVNGGIFEDPIRGLQVLHPPLHPGCRCSTTAFDESAGEEVDLMQPSLAASENSYA